MWKTLGLTFEEPKIVAFRSKPKVASEPVVDAACSFPEFKIAAE